MGGVDEGIETRHRGWQTRPPVRQMCPREKDLLCPRQGPTCPRRRPYLCSLRSRPAFSRVSCSTPRLLSSNPWPSPSLNLGSRRALEVPPRSCHDLEMLGERRIGRISLCQSPPPRALRRKPTRETLRQSAVACQSVEQILRQSSLLRRRSTRETIRGTIRQSSYQIFRRRGWQPRARRRKLARENLLCRSPVCNTLFIRVKPRQGDLCQLLQCLCLNSLSQSPLRELSQHPL
mmetsp:Transcript_33490/g.73779  ORF Transcript_33490/g.73779 Transcript_33490/m.73779 type:complete len:233 (-) Transcript_33490:3822-4520(-)